MNITILKKICFLFLGMGFSAAYAQESPVAAGGDATGIGGSVAYSVGQVVYTTNTGSTGMVSQGVQQTYEISTVGIEIQNDTGIRLSAYPNPVVDLLVLKINETDFKNLSYSLYDINGKLVESKNITGNETTLSMADLAHGGYILKVNNNSQQIKAFQIIKN